jgi:hypothetical protein
MELFLRYKSFLEYLGFDLLTFVKENIPYKDNWVLEYNLRLVNILRPFWNIFITWLRLTFYFKHFQIPFDLYFLTFLFIFLK